MDYGFVWDVVNATDKVSMCTILNSDIERQRSVEWRGYCLIATTTAVSAASTDLQFVAATPFNANFSSDITAAEIFAVHRAPYVCSIRSTL